MLETTILDQVRSVFQHLEARYVFHITYHPGHEQAQELIGFLKDVASCSDKLSCRMSEIENPVLEFTLLKDDVETGIKFRGIPGGHEFTSLLLAVLNADGKGKKLAGRSNSSPHPGVARRHQPANVCIAYLHQLSGCGAGTEHHRIAESARHPRDGGRGA